MQSTLRGVVKRFDETDVIHGVDLDVARRRVRRLRRPVGLRQIDAAADDLRPRSRDCRRHPHRRAPRQRRPAGAARACDGVPVLRALSAHDGATEHGLRARKHRHAEAGDRRARSPRRRGCCRLDELPQPATDSSSRAASGSASRSVARSCASRKIFLFDEPLSNLDAELRVSMRAELAQLHRRLNDDDDLRDARPGRGDDDGRQDRRAAVPAGSSRSARRSNSTTHPANRFVAGFIGSPRMNFLPARVVSAAPETVVLQIEAVGPVSASTPRQTAQRGQRDVRHSPRAPRGRFLVGPAQRCRRSSSSAV